MDSQLKRWASNGVDLGRLLAAQTQAAFDEYYWQTGTSKQDLARKLKRPLRAYKEPSRTFLAAIDVVTRQYKVEAWRAWGIFTEGRDIDAAGGEPAANALAARWEVSPEKLAAIYFTILGRIQSYVRVEQRAGDDTYLLMDNLTIRLGRVRLAEYMGLVNFAIAGQTNNSS